MRLDGITRESEDRSEGASTRYDLYIRARIRRSGPLIPMDAPSASSAQEELAPELAEALIENLTGVSGIPLGIAARFQLGGREFVAPMAIEEASISAGREAPQENQEPRSSLDGVEILDVQRILSALGNHGLWDDL